jgi:hypothetical protein
MSKVKEKLAKRVEQIDESVIEVHEVDVICEDRPANVVSIRSSEDNRPLDVVPSFAISLDVAKERIRLLQEFVQHMMVPGVDFGLIPGCQKPSLLKPGAEKLCDIFGFSKHVKVINRVEDWTKPFLAYEVMVTLINKRSGVIEAQGIGSANSREKKYANQDAYTIANSLIKISKKRALTDAVLSATRSSGLFTQDIEDMDLEPRPTSVQTQAKPPASSPASPATNNQVRKINQLIRDTKLSPEVVKTILLSFNVATVEELSKRDASTVIQQLMAKRNNPSLK